MYNKNEAAKLAAIKLVLEEQIFSRYEIHLLRINIQYNPAKDELFAPVFFANFNSIPTLELLATALAQLILAIKLDQKSGLSPAARINIISIAEEKIREIKGFLHPRTAEVEAIFNQILTDQSFCMYLNQIVYKQHSVAENYASDILNEIYTASELIKFLETTKNLIEQTCPSTVLPSLVGSFLGDPKIHALTKITHYLRELELVGTPEFV